MKVIIVGAGALKWWYSFAMIAGRLEIFTMLILVGRIIALCAAPAIPSIRLAGRSRVEGERIGK